MCPAPSVRWKWHLGFKQQPLTQICPSLIFVAGADFQIFLPITKCPPLHFFVANAIKSGMVEPARDSDKRSSCAVSAKQPTPIVLSLFRPFRFSKWVPNPKLCAPPPCLLWPSLAGPLVLCQKMDFDLQNRYVIKLKWVGEPDWLGYAWLHNNYLSPQQKPLKNRTTSGEAT